MAKACGRALAKSAARWEALAASDDTRQAFDAIADSYLTARHRDHPGAGCMLTAVGAEAARQGPSVRRALTDGLQSLLGALARVAPGRSRAAKRERAMATLAGMVGAVVLARAVDDARLSAAILESVRRTIGAPAR